VRKPAEESDNVRARSVLDEAGNCRRMIRVKLTTNVFRSSNTENEEKIFDRFVSIKNGFRNPRDFQIVRTERIVSGRRPRAISECCLSSAAGIRINVILERFSRPFVIVITKGNDGFSGTGRGLVSRLKRN